MISGIDVIMKNPMSLKGSCVIVRRYLELRFESAVFEDEDDEFFMYKDQAAKDAWDEHGLNDEHGNRMWYFIFQDDAVTMVFQERTAEIENVLDEIQNMLRLNHCF